MNKLELILSVLEDKKATHIRIIDLSSVALIHETMIVCDASNQRHLEALKTYVLEALELHSIRIHHAEGKPSSDWHLIDAYDVVVHFFLEPTRQHYHIEDLWADKWIVSPQFH